MSSPRDTIHSPTIANLSPENWPLLLLVNTTTATCYSLLGRISTYTITTTTTTTTTRYYLLLLSTNFSVELKFSPPCMGMGN